MIDLLTDPMLLGIAGIVGVICALAWYWIRRPNLYHR
jgi:hypothetical protein